MVVEVKKQLEEVLEVLRCCEEGDAAPQLAAGRAAVLPLRALPIASVTRNDKVAKQKSPLDELHDIESARALRASAILFPFLVLVCCIFYNEVTTPWTALDALFFGPR